VQKKESQGLRSLEGGRVPKRKFQERLETSHLQRDRQHLLLRRPTRK
jgi:hypothetical protein